MDYTKLTDSELDFLKRNAERNAHAYSPGYPRKRYWEGVYIECVREQQRREGQ